MAQDAPHLPSAKARPATHSPRALRAAVATLALLAALLTPVLTTAQPEQPGSQIHVTVAGETLPGIAARYGVPVRDLARANNLLPGSVLRAGTRLMVPAPPGQTGKVHIVRRNETLQQLALRYGVTVEDILLANDLASPDYLFVGQRLLMPVGGPPPAMPTPPPVSTPALPAPTAEPSACPGGCEALRIISPTLGLTVTSPLLVSGVGASAEGQLTLRVLDASGFEIGLDSVSVSDVAGPFTGTVAYAVPASSQTGRVQVYSVDRRDGAIQHLSSVVVILQGAGLDAAITALKQAVETQDYDALAAMLDDRWTLGFYRSEGMTLSAERALRQLRQNFLGPGDVTVDLSVDARRLLGDAVMFSSDVSHVVFSSGWGPDAADDALLLFATDETGQTRWTGMLYIYDGLREYQRP